MQLQSFSLVLSLLAATFVADLRGMSMSTALLRALRSSRIWLERRELRQRLLTNAAYKSHLAAVAKDDAVFFLSHHAFLAKGLTPAQRLRSALLHYEHETDAFDATYFDNVYRRGALRLWSQEAEGHVYSIRLMPGNDVMYEGGLSVVFFVDEQRVCVVSFSYVESAVFLRGQAKANELAGTRGATVFVTRKQLAADHGYQGSFNKAFDRTTPGHLCFAALAGVAAAQGHWQVIGIEPEVHPSFEPQYARAFDVAYAQFWESLAGRRESPYGYVIDLPMHMTSLEALDAKARKRAVARRRHIDAVFGSARACIGRRRREVARVASSVLAPIAT